MVSRSTFGHGQNACSILSPTASPCFARIAYPAETRKWRAGRHTYVPIYRAFELLRNAAQVDILVGATGSVARNMCDDDSTTRGSYICYANQTIHGAQAADTSSRGSVTSMQRLCESRALLLV